MSSSSSHFDFISHGHHQSTSSTTTLNGLVIHQTGTVRDSTSKTSGLSTLLASLIEPSTVPTDVSGGRCIILCFDGTGDQFDDDNSNVIEFLSMLRKDDPTKQLVYYQSGIGTYNDAHFVTQFATTMSKTLDTAIAWNLGSHIMDGYKFVMQNYCAGDRLCIFGFSRGAYTARCLVGMIEKIGIIPPWNIEQLPFAYTIYNDTSLKGLERARDFRQTFSTKATIHFVGVWDTVESVGLIPRKKPFATSDNAVRYFRHALALDEHRAKFKANTWNYLTEEEKMLVKYLDDRDKKNGVIEVQPNWVSNVKEVWFAGCHCDVGGGSVPNDTQYNLARIPLRWMIRECFATNTGIVFYEKPLLNLGMDPKALASLGSSQGITVNHFPKDPRDIFDAQKIVKEWAQGEVNRKREQILKLKDIPDDLRKAQKILEKRLQLIPKALRDSEYQQSLRDALCPEYDQLKIAKWWKIFEWLPLTQQYQSFSTGKWEYVREWNMGYGRVINGVKAIEEDSGDTKRTIHVHSSVKTRLHADEKGTYTYTPRVIVEDYKIEWRAEDGTVYDKPKLTKVGPKTPGWFTGVLVKLGFCRAPRLSPPEIEIVYVD